MKHGDFYEDDEPIEDILAAYNRGNQTTTTVRCTVCGTTASGNIGGPDGVWTMRCECGQTTVTVATQDGRLG